MLCLVTSLVCGVEHEGYTTWASPGRLDRLPMQQHAKSSWRQEVQRDRREERRALDTAMEMTTAHFQRLSMRQDRTSQGHMVPRGVDQGRSGKARQGRQLRSGFEQQDRVTKHQERGEKRTQQKARLSDGQQERMVRSAALYAALQPEEHKGTLKGGAERRDPDAPCGAACRDPLTPGPKFDAVERNLVTPIDDKVATSQSRVRTCPSLSELIPCVGQKGFQNETAPCTVCLPANLETTFHADKEVLFANNLQRRLHTVEGALQRGETNGTAPGGAGIMTKPVYLIVAVPPFSGSSGLEGLISTSPAASTMCSKSIWQCEATSFLLQHKLFDYKDRWNPTATNWTRVYEVYYKDVPGTVWDDPHKTILVDKSPPNLAKSKGMVDFFEKHKMDYRFVVRRPTHP